MGFAARPGPSRAPGAGLHGAEDMAHRSVRPLAVAVVAAWLAVLASDRPSAQAARPDLQGVCLFSSLTPVEGPAEFAGRASLTLKEAADYERQVMERNNADRRDGPVETD